MHVKRLGLIYAFEEGLNPVKVVEGSCERMGGLGAGVIKGG